MKIAEQTLARVLYVFIAEHVDGIDEKKFNTAVACLGINRLFLYLKDLGIIIEESIGSYRVSMRTIDGNETYTSSKVYLLYNAIVNWRNDND